MQPIYMPFTYISQRAAEIIHTLLGQTILIHPGGLPVPFELENLVEKGLIRLRTPVNLEADDLLAALKHDYHAWAALKSDRSKLDSGGFMAALDKIPFYSEDSSSYIRSEIKRLRGGKAQESEKDSILAARLFLALALDYDLEKNNIDQRLNAVANMEKTLLEQLKGEGEEILESSSPFIGREDLGAYMTRQRIEAWSALLMSDKEPPDGLFVTDSQAVVEQLCDECEALIVIPDAEKMIEIKPICCANEDNRELTTSPLLQLSKANDPMALINTWLQKEGNQVQSEVHWSLYLAPEISPRRFWSTLGKCFVSKKNDGEKESDILNTLIFHFES